MSEQSEQQAFHDAMAKDRNDHTTRLVYADWLDEHGQPEAAHRLRTWGRVLPYLPKEAGGRGDGKKGTLIAKVPDWFARLAITHFNRSYPHQSDEQHAAYAQDELHAAGVHGVEALPSDTPAIASERRLALVRGEGATRKWWVTNHVLQAAKAAAKMNLPLKLARTKVGAGGEPMRAPAGGLIQGGGTAGGGVYQQGGRFVAKARQRIRTTVIQWLASHAGLERLARGKGRAKTPKGDLTPEGLRFDADASGLTPDSKTRLPKLPAADDEILKAKQTADPDKLRSKLTVRELKDVERSLQLPNALKLSNKHGNEKRQDHEEVNNLDLDSYYTWANDVARHVQNRGLTQTARARLRDPKYLSKSKLAFIVDRLTREVKGAKSLFADTGGAHRWYGDHVAAMTRHLHDSFHSGKPEDDELWGKLDKKTGRVNGGAAITLAKMLVAATSGGMKPHENYDTAHKMIAAGRRAGGGSVNTFKSIPDNQGEEFRDWVDRVAQWHAGRDTGVTKKDVLRPGTSLKDRALWYERVVRPLLEDKKGEGGRLAGGASEGRQRYSGVKTEYVSDPTSEHYGAPVAVDKGKDGWKSPYPTTAAHPLFPTLSLEDEHKGALAAPEGEADYSKTLVALHPSDKQRRRAKLPAVDERGYLQAPGWTARNGQVLNNRNKLNAVVAYFTHEAKGDDRKGMIDAAHFFLTPQKHEDFQRVIDWTAAHDSATAEQLRKAATENRGFYYEGDQLPGAFLLGPKFGAFAMNLHLDGGDHERFGGHLTADLWWSRDWNVMLGSLFGPKGEKGDARQETPRGRGASHPERKLMRKAAQLAAKAAGLSNVAELQAVLWYYEQQKPRWFGVDTSSTSYLDGVNQVAEREGKKYTIHPVSGAIRVEKVKGGGE